MNTFIHHSRDSSVNPMIEDDLCEQMHCMQNLMFETHLNGSCADVTNCLDEEGKMMLLHSPLSPRMTICQIMAHGENCTDKEQGPMAPLITPSSPIPSQFQREDKILRWRNAHSLTSVYFPTLPVDHNNSNSAMTHPTNHKNHAVSDLSSLPLPQHIRLLPRRRKPVPRNCRNWATGSWGLQFTPSSTFLIHPKPKRYTNQTIHPFTISNARSDLVLGCLVYVFYIEYIAQKLVMKV